jgi:hypothetical protein
MSRRLRNYEVLPEARIRLVINVIRSDKWYIQIE